MQTCLFCDSDKEANKVAKDKDFICSNCTTLLMSIGQDKLQKAYELCIQQDKRRKASAIETFLEEVRYVGNDESESRNAEDDRSAAVNSSDNDGSRTGESSRCAVFDRQTASL